MLTDGKIIGIVKDTVREQLAPCSVDVSVRTGTDADGDAVLHIMVVFSQENCLDKRKMLGLARHIRSNLAEAASTSFPMLSFISKQDAAKMDFEAA